MITQFVSEPLKPHRSFNPSAMATGAPGLPAKFLWRKTDLVVAEILETGKEFGDCTHGSGERYVRRHSWRIRTTDDRVAHIYFQRSFGKSRPTARWWLQGFEAGRSAEIREAPLVAPADRQAIAVEHRR